MRRSAELYINVCNILDRLVKRTEGVAADHARVAVMLGSLTEMSSDTYATDTNEVPLLNDGLLATSKHLRTCQTLLEDESRGWDEGVLEDLKRQRDALVSVRDMFDRRERLDRDNIPYLEKRIQTNETKLTGLRSKPEGAVKAGEIERVAESIIKAGVSRDAVDESRADRRVRPNRTRSRLCGSTTSPSLSRSASATSSSRSSPRSTTSPGGTRTGPENGSSTPRCWPTTGGACWTSSRACRSETEGSTREAPPMEGALAGLRWMSTTSPQLVPRVSSAPPFFSLFPAAGGVRRGSD